MRLANTPILTVIFIFSLLIGNSQKVFPQIMAITDTGEEVILYDDGTWVYSDPSFNADSVTQISTNPTLFVKDSSATFLLKSKKIDVGVWLDPKKWSFTRSVGNPEAEYEINLKGEELYGMLIVERTELPLTFMKNAAITNARQVAPDIRVVEEEFRTVNGYKMLYLRLQGTITGLRLSYLGYYYSGPEGTAQLVTFSSTDLIEDYKDEAHTLLQGLTALEEE